MVPPGISRGRILGVAGLLLLAGLIAYFNSFQGVFVFDDQKAILDNHNIRSLSPIWTAMTSPQHSSASGRPLLGLTLALNYAISGYDVWSYHLFNLAIHLLAGLTLFGIVRRTLISDVLSEKLGKSSTTLAAACALIWLVHPLHTGSVTYIIQRAESLMGLFYLLTIYCAIRGFESPGRRRWPVLAIVACFLSAITKEVTATLPVILLLYDRTFAAGSFKESLRRRWWMYAGMCAVWVVPLINALSGARAASGFDFSIGPLEYFQMQCNIVLGYLFRVFWPGSLIFDYGWPRPTGFLDYAPAGLALLILGIGTLVALRYRPAIGFLGAWFFVILGPSSSFLVIIAEIGADHRMYLPSAAVICAAVLGACWLGNRFLKGKTRLALGLAVTLAVVTSLAVLTHLRNRDYHSLVTLWSDNAHKTPDNFRAHQHLARAYVKTGDLPSALRYYDRTLELHAHNSEVYTNRGIIYGRLKQNDRALADFSKAIAINPDDDKAYLNRGFIHFQRGEFRQALTDLDMTLRLRPGQAKAHMLRGDVLARLGEYRRAVHDLKKALQLGKDDPRTVNNLRKRIEQYRQLIRQ